MLFLRPFLFAILGAFVAAAPAAPLSGAPQKSGHRQPKAGEAQKPERGHDAEQGADRAGNARARGSAPAGSNPDRDGGSAAAPTAAAVRAFPVARSTRCGPTRSTRAAVRRPDLRAGLLSLPPPTVHDV